MAHNQLQNAMVLGQQSNICKLNVDCFEELFDWLSLEDLHSVGQTCKRLHQIAGYIFRETYPGAYVECKNGGIFIGDVSVNGFCEFVENVSLCGNNLRCFQFMKSNQFKSLKRIEFHDISFNDGKIDCIKHILMKGANEGSAPLEDIQLCECRINGEFYEKFLQYCSNLKRLSLKPLSNCLEQFQYDAIFCAFFYNQHFLIGYDDDWMLRKYPKLEYFRLDSDQLSHQSPRLVSFFKQNPNIRKFATCASFISKGVINLGLEVDDLAITCNDIEITMYKDLYDSLSAKKMFKRLQLYEISISPRIFLDLEGIRALEKLHCCPDSLFSLNSLTSIENLKTLCVSDVGGKVNIDAISTLTQLEKVFLFKAKLLEMEAFIVHLPKLKTISIETIKNDGNIGNNISKWNRERKHLAGACKVTVYVPNYQAAKWSAHETNCKLVELKRFESYEWDYDFGYRQGQHHQFH